MKILVARYNEDIVWTKGLENVLVYNKGDDLSGDYSVVKLDNVGREGHSYYKYIYDNYDNLEDYTIFLQGNPFDHSPNILKNIEMIKKYLLLPGTKEIDFLFLSEQMCPTNLSGCWHHENGRMKHKTLPLLDIYEILFNKRLTELSYAFGGGAQFIVSRARIHSRPKEFYLKIIELLAYDKDPIEGYVIERFHTFIFGLNH